MAIQKITAKIIADGAIVAADVADGSITNAKIDSVANTKITGNIISSQITSVANTQITGLITSGQIASNITLSGNTTISTINLTGGQIIFPATAAPSADANTLDDYEEGTWTPVLQGASSAGTYTYDTARTNGKYIKIGKMVSVFGVYRIDTVTSAGTGVAKITGLPFTAAALDTGWDRIPGMLRVQSGPTLANNGYFCYTENPGTFLGIGLQGVADWTEVSVTDADAVGAVWFFQCTYEAA